MKFAEPPSSSVASELLLRIADTQVHHSPRAVDRPVALYGAGNLGRMAREYFDRLGIPVAFVIDRNAEQCKRDRFWDGVDVLSPDSVSLTKRRATLLAVSVVTSPYTELAEGLRAEGWTDVVPFYDIAEAYRDRHPLSNGWFADPFSVSDTENIAQLMNAWADDVSRGHHLQFLAWRRLREDWSFGGAPVCAENRFFIPEVVAALTDHESFADIGAHTGSVTLRFLETVDGRFEKIWAIEPDLVNLSALRLTISNLPAAVKEKVKIIPAAVGRKQGKTIFFQGLGYSSQCSGLGKNSLFMETIDDLGLSPSFMKMHLEGAELDALKGARNTLHRYRPIIVATSYHGRNGLWELPKWLMEELPDYILYMRNHSWCGTGAVVYCVPKLRNGFRLF